MRKRMTEEELAIWRAAYGVASVLSGDADVAVLKADKAVADLRFYRALPETGEGAGRDVGRKV